MVSSNAFNNKSIEIPFSTGIHRMCIGDTLFIEPFGNFKATYHFCSCSAGNTNTIGDMIRMSMRNQNIIRLNIINFNNGIGQIIRGYEWIKQHLLFIDRN